jgi:hypothetical protein
MSRMTSTKETELSIITPADLANYCPDLSTWAHSWRYEDKDILPGEQLVEILIPFLRHLLNEGRTRVTRNRHRDSLWLLGGEFIGAITEKPKLRKRPVLEVLLGLIANGEGPLVNGGRSESDQNALDATCRKLHRFLLAS